jgi:hypothetical protein
VVAHLEQRNKQQDLRLELVDDAASSLLGEVGRYFFKTAELLLLHLADVPLYVVPLNDAHQAQDLLNLAQVGLYFVYRLMLDRENHINAGVHIASALQPR